MIEYSDAPEVRDIANKLIPDFHPHLQDEEIDYVFRSKAGSRGNKVILGTAKKMRGLVSFLARQTEDDFFVMQIGLDTWNRLDDKKKEALVDHELCHFGFSESGDRIIIPHDLEEFADVIERHGMWSQGILA